jgi:hypothetical protein
MAAHARQRAAVVLADEPLDVIVKMPLLRLREDAGEGKE